MFRSDTSTLPLSHLINYEVLVWKISRFLCYTRLGNCYSLSVTKRQRALELTGECLDKLFIPFRGKRSLGLKDYNIREIVNFMSRYLVFLLYYSAFLKAALRYIIDPHADNFKTFKLVTLRPSRFS